MTRSWGSPLARAFFQNEHVTPVSHTFFLSFGSLDKGKDAHLDGALGEFDRFLHVQTVQVNAALGLHLVVLCTVASEPYLRKPEYGK